MQEQLDASTAEDLLSYKTRGPKQNFSVPEMTIDDYKSAESPQDPTGNNRAGSWRP